jgi:ribosome-associated toxin RatA of RatAB toxin-antitoxin module
MIKIVLDVPATRPHVFSVLIDFGRYREWMPGCKSSKITRQEGNILEVDLKVASMKTMNMGLRFELSPPKMLNFTMVKGTDIKSYSGSWTLMDSADQTGTVVMGEVEMDAGAMVPKFMVTRLATKAIQQTAEALKKRIAVVPFEGEEGKKAPLAAPAQRYLIHVLQTPEGYRTMLKDRVHYHRHLQLPAS